MEFCRSNFGDGNSSWKGSKGSNIANHAWSNNHLFDFENARVIDKGKYCVRKTLESWHTAKTINADDNSKPLLRQYSILL